MEMTILMRYAGTTNKVARYKAPNDQLQFGTVWLKEADLPQNPPLAIKVTIETGPGIAS